MWWCLGFIGAAIACTVAVAWWVTDGFSEGWDEL